MEVSGQFHAALSLTLDSRLSGHCKKKTISSPFRESNRDSSVA
jgi:hypothetical protein